jgi:hypothetical protein
MCESSTEVLKKSLHGGPGASIPPTRPNASIAICQVPFPPFSVLNQLPWMALSLTITE